MDNAIILNSSNLTDFDINTNLSIKNENKNNVTFYTTGNKIINPYELIEVKANIITPHIYPETLLQKSDINYLSNYLNDAFEVYEGVYHYLNYQDKIEFFIKIILDEKNYSPHLRLGSLIAIYNLLNNNNCNYNNIKKLIDICLQIIINFQNYYEFYLCICLDILSLINDKEILLNNIDLISLFLTDDNFPYLQESSFNCIFHLGNIGIKTLIEISKNYPKYQEFILTKLIETPHIQNIIVVKELLNELKMNKSFQIITDALLALNQLYWIVSGQENYQYKIAELYEDEKIDKFLISSVLRTSGKKGNELLTNLLKNHPNFSVRSSICKVFNKRIFYLDKFLNIKLNFNRQKNINNNPNLFFKYHFSDSLPVCDERYDKINNKNYLEIYSEAFLAGLNRFQEKNFYINSDPILTNEGKTINSIFSYDRLMEINNLENFFPLKNHLNDIKQKNNIDFINQYKITPEIINSLCNALIDKVYIVRDNAGKTLTKIGYPETQNAIKPILNIIMTSKEKDEKIYSNLFKILSSLNLQNYLDEIIELIRNNFNKYSNNQKIIQSTLLLIPHLKNNCPEDILDYLEKFLLLSHVDLISFAKSLIFAGINGENKLINLFNTKKNNYKLISNIANAFSYCEVDSPNIDLIIEILLNERNSKSALVRKNILLTLINLSKYEYISTYLINKNILDIYYNSLNDFDEQIAFICMKQLISFGAKGELLFIQGILNDKNNKKRIMCALGLTEMGIQNLSTLLIAYYEEKEKNVKENIENLILDKYNNDKGLKQIINFYKNKENIHKKNSLIQHIKHLDNSMVLNLKFKKFLNNILELIKDK